MKDFFFFCFEKIDISGLALERVQFDALATCFLEAFGLHMLWQHLSSDFMQVLRNSLRFLPA